MSNNDFVTAFGRHTEPEDTDLRITVFTADSRTPVALLLTAQSTAVRKRAALFSARPPTRQMP